jgi:DnaA family protein
MPTKMTQLTLNITSQDANTFDHYLAGNNQAVVERLLILTPTQQDPSLFLWGNPGTGRSHLLQATCHHRTQQGMTAAYLPLADHQRLSPEILIGMENMGLLCLDDIDAIMGNPDWETALFHAYNRCQDSGTQLLMTATQPCRQFDFYLADLRSRLLSIIALEIKPLEDKQKLIGLQSRAHARGLTLSDAAGTFLLHHYTRDMHTLFQLLDRLDKASLSTQRRLTIHFIKATLS